VTWSVARAIAEVVQINRPDVLLLNEFDYAPDNLAADLFNKNYLRVGQNGKAPVDYPYVYTAPSNTGVPSSYDLNKDGIVGGPDDALGFGSFEGQYGMVVYSKYPIQLGAVRTFRNFLWQDMPGALLPDNPATEAEGDWYSADELDVLPLSSKSHWDIPISVGGRTVHVLASHPTPPVFDGVEDRNGRRNSDEIRFWSDYVTSGQEASYVYDDDGTRGGLKRGERFVIMGDQNRCPPPRGRSRRRRCRGARTQATSATRGTTPRTSRTAPPAISVPTTYCRPVRCASSHRASSGPASVRPARNSRGSSPSRPATTGWSTSTSW
jgi:hypothetical protein